jgi:glycosyltransferase involved in cell wall biosynthesis
LKQEGKIKLLVFIPTLECGGTEKYVSLLCNNINTDKFDVTLVVLNNAHPFYEINTNNINLVNLGVKRVSRSFWAIKKMIRQQQPDIILTTANHLNLLFAMFRHTLAKKIPVIARESSIVSINNRRASMPGLYNWLVKRFYHRFDVILCQSVYMQQDLIKNFNMLPDKTRVIHNPVQEVAVNIPLSAATHPGKNKFITVARLSAEKGIDRLIQAVAKLSLPYQYYIVGEGNERAALQKQIEGLQLQDKIFLSGEKIKPWLHMEDADLFLSGSYYEGFPNALLEAGALGIPVIAFDAPGGTCEIITEGGNGLLVKDNDITAFTAAIEKALQAGFNRAGIIAATKKRFSLAANLQAVEELLLRAGKK